MAQMQRGSTSWNPAFPSEVVRLVGPPGGLSRPPTAVSQRGGIRPQTFAEPACRLSHPD